MAGSLRYRAQAGGIDKPSCDALLMADIAPGMRLRLACSGGAGNVATKRPRLVQSHLNQRSESAPLPRPNRHIGMSQAVVRTTAVRQRHRGLAAHPLAHTRTLSNSCTFLQVMECILRQPGHNESHWRVGASHNRVIRLAGRACLRVSACGLCRTWPSAQPTVDHRPRTGTGNEFRSLATGNVTMASSNRGRWERRNSPHSRHRPSVAPPCPRAEYRLRRSAARRHASCLPHPLDLSNH